MSDPLNDTTLNIKPAPGATPRRDACHPALAARVHYAEARDIPAHFPDSWRELLEKQAEATRLATGQRLYPYIIHHGQRIYLLPDIETTPLEPSNLYKD